MAEVAHCFYATPQGYTRKMKLLNPLLAKGKYHIKNSEHTVELLNEINLNEDVFISYKLHCLPVYFVKTSWTSGYTKPRRTLSGTIKKNSHQKR